MKTAGSRATVIGGGAWGTALAVQLARNGCGVAVLTRRPEIAAALLEGRHPRIPDIQLPVALPATTDARAALAGSEVVIFAVTMSDLRERLATAGPLLADRAVAVSAAKGIEPGRLRLPSALLAEACGGREVVALGGPTMASEVIDGLPCLAVCAGPGAAAGKVAGMLRSRALRAIVTTDVVGCELGGSLKNVYNLVLGYAIGQGWGHNGVAALLDACLLELRAVALAAGADDGSLLGLAGLADFVAAAWSPTSRNRRFGEAVGRGERPDIREVTEGTMAAPLAAQLAAHGGVRTPLLDAAADIAALRAADSLADRLLDTIAGALAGHNGPQPATAGAKEGVIDR